MERRLVHFFQKYGNTGVSEDHGDATAHSTCANNRSRFYRNNRGFLGNAGNLADFALAEKDVDERFRLFGEQALDEKFLFGLAAFLERHFGGDLDGIDSGNWSEQTALFLGHRFPRGGKDRRVVRGISKFSVSLPGFGGRLTCNFARKCNCS